MLAEFPDRPVQSGQRDRQLEAEQDQEQDEHPEREARGREADPLGLGGEGHQQRAGGDTGYRHGEPPQAIADRQQPTPQEHQGGGQQHQRGDLDEYDLGAHAAGADTTGLSP